MKICQKTYVKDEVKVDNIPEQKPSKSSLGSDFEDEKNMVEEFCFGYDVCFEEELKRLEESVSDISKYSRVIKKEVLEDGKSKIRILMEKLEEKWLKIDMNKLSSAEDGL